MAAVPHNDLRNRIEHLEIQNRRMKRAAGAGLALATILVLGAQTIPQDKAIEAQAFELVNNTGAVVASLRLLDNGNAGLVFYGVDGEPQASMSPRAVSFYGADGSIGRYGRTAVTLAAADESGATLWTDEDGASGLIFVDENETPRMEFLLDAEGVSIVLKDMAGSVVWQVPPER